MSKVIVFVNAQLRPKIQISLLWVILFMALNLPANAQTSDALITEAWKAWAANQQPQVEAKFLAALKENRNSTRAYLGLSFLYAMQGKQKEAWEVYKQVLQIEPNLYPYLYAAILTPKLRQNLNVQSGVLPLLEKVSQKADAGGVLKAQVNETLGGYYEQKGEITKAKQYYQTLNALRDWTVIGPFENVSASGLDKEYPPELDYDSSKTYAAKGNILAKWFKLAAIRNDNWIDFTRYFAHTESVFYANSFVFSPRKQTVQFRLGTSGSCRVFLNDERILECAEEYNNGLDNFIVETELQEGWNRLLIKCGYSEISWCNFLARFTDEHGETIKGLELSSEAKPYKKRPGAITKSIENFAEAYFKARIKESPDYLENYLLLAECYLRNDKATDAELTLREAIKRSPTCALLYLHLLDAYTRGKKYDEATTTIAKIETLDKQIPDVYEYKIVEHLRNQEFYKAEELLKQLAALMPESERVYLLYLRLYGFKQQDDKIIETSKLAYKKYPDNWDFVTIEAVVAVETTRKYDGAIRLLEDYLKKQYTDTVLVTLANYYLQASDVKKWQATYNKVFEIDPASTDSYHQMANVYSVLQDYDNAEKMIRKALELCPNSSVYWSKLGEILRIKNQPTLAKEAYREALKFDACDYNAIEALRELDGKKPVFSLFEAVKIEDLIKSAPDAKAYPDSGGVILLQDVRRVVYEQGASESAEELVVKVFNKKGIEDFKEYWISYNPYTEKLIIEKAVVIKSNGSEIKADVSENHIVFKSLEENDVIHLNWRIKNYYSGKLAGDFWDTHYFNGFYPIRSIRYSLLTPKTFKFQSSTHNMPNQPAKRETADSLIYQWTLSNEPAIDYEYDMPVVADVGKVLYISSIGDWESVVNWYADLARTKTRTSFEIKEQVEKLFPRKENLSEESKIEAVYNFITGNIRYSSVPFRQSAFIPQKARDVLVNKIGDCKDMATLCIAMLGEVGLKAYYVLVNTRDAGQNQNALPTIAFNHCLVAVETKSGLKYLDLTADNYPLNSMPETDLEAFMLLIRPGVKAPEYLARNRFAPCQEACQSKITIQADMSMVDERRVSSSGAAGADIRQGFRHKGQKEREKVLTEGLAQQFPGVKLTRLEMENVDDLKPLTQVTYHFEVPNYVTEAGQFKLLRIPWAAGFGKYEGLSYEQRKFPLLYWTDMDKQTEEMEIQVPAGYEPVELIKETKLTSAIADYSISFTFANGIIKGRRELVNKKVVVSPEEYAEFKKFYNSVIKEDDRQILLKVK